LTATRLSLVYLPDGDDLRVAVVSGPAETPLRAGQRLPISGSFAGESLQSGRAMMMPASQDGSPLYAEERRWFGENAYMTVPLLTKHQPLGVIAVADKLSGGLGPADERVLTMLAPGAVVALENARLYQSEHERRQELEALYRADEELHRHLQLDEVLQSLVDVAVDILQADKSALVVWDAHRQRLVVRLARGLSPATTAQLDFAPGQGVFGRAALSGEPLWVAEVEPGDPRLPRRMIELEGIRSFVLLPLRIEGRVFGVFNINYCRPRTFRTEEQRLIAALAQRAALAIENARLYEQAQQVAVMQERQRLARELHDAVTQTLFSASLIAKALPGVWERQPEEGRRGLEELRQLTRSALAEMRMLLLELRPAALAENGLGELLQHLTAAIASRTRIPITLQVTGEYALATPVQVALYRISQEALNNCAKHARANRVTVRLSYQPRQVKLCIADDGCGFEPDRIRPGHMGLSIMAERARAIGATWRITSRPGRGTQIVVAWPNAGTGAER